MPLVYIPVYKEQPPVPISAFFCVCVCVSRSKHGLITGHCAQPDCARLSSEHRREWHSCPKAFKVNSQGIWEMCEGACLCL